MVLMRDEVVQKGAEFLIITLSNPEQVHPDISVRQELMVNLDVDDLFYPDRRVKALGDQENFEVMNLARDFAEYAEQNNVCLHGFDNAIPCGGDWNASGHLLAGKMIAQKLCSDYIKPLGKIENSKKNGRVTIATLPPTKFFLHADRLSSIVNSRSPFIEVFRSFS